MNPSPKRIRNGDETAPPPPHVIVIPCPAMGHISPALQFCKNLASKGISVTLLIFTDKTLFHGHGLGLSQSVAVEVITDEGIMTTPSAGYYERYRDLVCRELTKFVKGHAARPSCVVYDSLFPWVLGTAKGMGMMAAPFFTQPVAVNAVYMNLMGGREAAAGFPVDAAAMEAGDLPSFVSDVGSYPGTLGIMKGQLGNVGEADWVFCNTFYRLEEELINWMTAHSIQVTSVGPTIPTAYLGKENPSETTTEYGLSLFNPTGLQTAITQYLDSKPPRSVIYASLGSISNTPENQILELARALHLSNRPFIWVVREPEQCKLPPGFVSGSTGLIVDWCRQLEVLAHQSVGCFVTHCGWNSTIEAISLGVPMVALPIWADQPTNAKFVEDVWRVGARARKDDVARGVVTKEEIGRRIGEVMGGESGEEIRRNVDKWKELAREAVAAGGSSEKNVEEFVAAVFSRR